MSDKQREAARVANTKHGDYTTALYHVWEAMKQRCKNPTNPAYKTYGGVGITFQSDWEQYLNFKAWAIHSGYKEGFELDRKDNLKGYSAENCRWASRSEQCFNKRSGRTSSGRIGVSYDKSKSRWVAQLVKDGEKVFFKRFKTFGEACEAIEEAELKHYGISRAAYLQEPL